MLSFISLNKTALIFAFSVFSFTGSYAIDKQESRNITRGDDRGGSDRSEYQDRNINSGFGYGTGYGVGYGGAAVNPQYPYEAQSNTQTFPDDADFNGTYEQNAHPPR